jgi:tetratricopeptide (TPR) repeat protein
MARRTAALAAVAAAVLGAGAAAQSQPSPSRPPLGPEDSARVSALVSSITTLREEGRFADGLGPAREILNIRARAQGESWWETLDAARLVATLERVASLPRSAQDELAEAERDGRRALEAYMAGRFDEAMSLLERQHEALAHHLSGDHPETIDALGNRGVLLYARGDHAAAAPICRGCLDRLTAVLGEEHPARASLLNTLGNIAFAAGRLAEAEALYGEAVAIARRAYPPGHPSLSVLLGNLASALHAAGLLAVAEAVLLESMRIAEAAGEGN